MLGIPFSQDPSPFILFQLVLFSKPLDFGLLQIKTFFFLNYGHLSLPGEDECPLGET